MTRRETQHSQSVAQESASGQDTRLETSQTRLLFRESRGKKGLVRKRSSFARVFNFSRQVCMFLKLCWKVNVYVYVRRLYASTCAERTTTQVSIYLDPWTGSLPATSMVTGRKMQPTEYWEEFQPLWHGFQLEQNTCEYSIELIQPTAALPCNPRKEMNNSEQQERVWEIVSLAC